MKPLSEVNWNYALLKGTASAGLGVLLSLVVNTTLAEISINSFYSVVSSTQYFGLLFGTIGGLLCWRGTLGVSFPFGLYLMCSGALCVFLDKNWFVGLTPLAKIPLYAVLGTAVSFAMTFALVDIIHFLAYWLNSKNPRAIVDNPRQLLAVLFMSLLTGLLFGLMFGLLDIEDAKEYHLRLALMKEERFCYPIGALFGFITGWAVEYFRLDYETTLGKFNEEI